MNPFKVGDVVNFYNENGKISNCKIESVSQNIVLIRTPVGTGFNAHYKQCRKVKKRREFWINVYKDYDDTSFYPYPTKQEADEASREDRIECIHVIEKREKK